MSNEFSANLVISPSGSIIAVDIIDPGSGYTSTPAVRIVNPGGYGAGAVIKPIMKQNPGDLIPFDINGCGNPTNSFLPNFNSRNNKTVGLGAGGYAQRPTITRTTNIIPIEPPEVPKGKSIDKFVILDTGVGYLQQPNGATGGGGVKFSYPEETIIFCGGYNVYPPCTNVTVRQGYLAYLPNNSIGQVFNDEGELIQTIVGRGPVIPIEIINDGILSTPCISREEVIPPTIPTTPTPTPTPTLTPTPTPTLTPTTPTVSDGTYPVALEIGDIYIENPGIRYSPEDIITIEPSNGSILEPEFDSIGRVAKVNIINSGIGFTEFPKVRIYSNTGVNANIIPIFNVIRITEEVLEKDIVPLGTPLVSVVDCVGIQTPKREFVRVEEN